MKAKKAAFFTLGCKVNQYDTEAIQAQFRADGYDIVDFNHDKADVYLINTCTVTNVSDGKSRQMIRRARRKNPEAKIVVVGCFAQTDPKQVAAIPGVNLIVGTNNRHKIVELVNNLKLEEQYSLVDDIFQVREFEEFDVFTFQRRTRASLKIQDGCNQFCSYCKVPYARGPSRSRTPENVIAQVKKIANQGYREIVLTGVHLGAYGRDLSPHSSLTSIVEAITLVEGVERIRISSVDPNEIDDELIALVAYNPKVCRHLHIPLQSGSDEILAKMRRRYSTKDFFNIVKHIKSLDPEIAVTTDIIVGFPGETQELFEESYKLLRELELAKIHVFKYSPRTNTPAAKYPNQVNSQEKVYRSHIMMELSNQMAAAFNRKFIDQRVRVLLETENQDRVFGLTDNYLHVSSALGSFVGSELIGKIMNVKIIDADFSQAEGILI